MSNGKRFAATPHATTIRAMPAPPPEPAEAAKIDPRQLYEVCPMCAGTRLMPVAFKRPAGTLCLGCDGLRVTPVGVTIKQFNRIVDAEGKRQAMSILERAKQVAADWRAAGRSRDDILREFGEALDAPAPAGAEGGAAGG